MPAPAQSASDLHDELVLLESTLLDNELELGESADWLSKSDARLHVEGPHWR